MGSVMTPQQSPGTTGVQAPIADSPLGQPRRIRVICIGAGITGINLAYMLPKHIKNLDYVMYDKNPEVGGTWFENTYPGVACDIPAHIYQYAWAPNPNWSEFYASGKEILAYVQSVAQKFDLVKFARLQHTVCHASWDESEGIWNVKIKNDLTGEIISDTCQFLINGGGFLNNWRLPQIPGIHSFAGPLLHSANWDASIALEGKRVGVIGNGSSGIQLVTAIQPLASHLTTFIRNPTWISTVYAQEFASEGGGNFKYSEEQKKSFQNDSEKYLAYRKAIETEMNGKFEINFKDSEFQKMARAYLADQMRKRLGEGHPLASKLIPDFAVGCRRLTPGVGYLEALTSENTTVIQDPIDYITPTGVQLKEGNAVDLDVLVCATGFDVSWAPRFPIIGRNGTNLQERWTRSRAAAYMAMAVPDFPNYFIFLGPGGPHSHGSAIPTIEHQTRYIIRMIYKAQTEGYKAIAPSSAATEEFLTHMKEFNKKAVWSDNCSSWLKQGSDQASPLCHPGSRIHWFHMLQAPRWEDWIWEPITPGNRFSYLGNGYTTWEEEGKDISWYIDPAKSGLEVIRY
ncbi:putative monooxygenase [Microdochium trichocladiopsis]|uniref:Monooxygenase n=1 Tax=Microdochium trichocladiopsis TaxID=1682393 RepID=A0A9P8XXU0_9PEZI|nr:putative monooxygenase [Microdochium trichocladiopsis]KAH7024782.1 putative monooxygenase [Microdochium trichocladiopsis]